MMDETDRRRDDRVMHRAKIRVSGGDWPPEPCVLEMRDFSERGLFLSVKGELMPPLNARVEVQLAEIEDAPLQAGRVVRVEEGIGFAVEFLPDASEAV